MEKDIILDVRKLNASFLSDKQEIHIVKDVSLQLKRGGCLAIVGESGCGKSVTVHSIVNLMPKNAHVKSEGVLYRARNGESVKEYRLDKLKNYGREMRSLRGKEIGMVFQDPMSSLDPVYRVGDQVAENIRQHKKISKEEALSEVVSMFKKLGIPDPERRIKQYPHEFSGGMKQRVVIAIAMICNPEILIADEPTTALDVTIQAQIMELMKELQIKDSKSIILITHNMGLVAEMADEVAVMYMGRIVEFGTIEDIFLTPSHPYTKALLRSVPVLGMDEGRELETIPGSTPNPSHKIIGCEFAARCSEACDACRIKAVEAYEVSPDHMVRCVKFSDCVVVE